MDDATKNNNDSWYYILMIIMLMMEDEKEKEEQWNTLEHDLIYKNRFSSDNPIVEEIHNRALTATKIMETGSVFYRARSFKQANGDKLMRYYLKETGSTEAKIKTALSEMPRYQKDMWLSMINSQAFNDVDDSDIKAVFNMQKKWKTRVRFKGYNAKDSTAPEADLVPQGRANPDHIRYLYLCEDKITPIYEIRPMIGEVISVAKFKLLKEAKIYDLTLNILQNTENQEASFPSLYNTVGKMFSKPYNGNASKYIPTQFLAEEIKRMGFDGIRFNSSLHKGGVNVVLFDPETCKAISSDLVEVKSIEIKTDTPSFYKIGASENENAAF